MEMIQCCLLSLGAGCMYRLQLLNPIFDCFGTDRGVTGTAVLGAIRLKDSGLSESPQRQTLVSGKEIITRSLFFAQSRIRDRAQTLCEERGIIARIPLSRIFRAEWRIPGRLDPLSAPAHLLAP